MKRAALLLSVSTAIATLTCAGILAGAGCGPSKPPESTTAPSSSNAIDATASAPIDAGSASAAAGDAEPSGNGGGGAAIGEVTPDCAKDIARMSPGFRSCYNKGLAKNPKLEGAVVISALAHDDGGIVSVETKSKRGLNPDVVDCIRNVVATHALHCAAPGETKAFDIPVAFVAPQDAGRPVFASGTDAGKK